LSIATLPDVHGKETVCQGTRLRGREKAAVENNQGGGIPPTVLIESVMLSATIDEMEERDVDTVYIPGEFMTADIDEVVHVRFKGEIA
jgi:hypothetical protein